MSTDPEPTDAPAELDRSKPPFLRRVRIRGYKSIAFCDVTLEPLTILVGRNASGKSNFLDALAFLRDVVVKGVRQAVHDHGGADAVLCKWSDEPRVTIEIEANYLPQRESDVWTAFYKVELDLSNRSSPRIVREQLQQGSLDNPIPRVTYAVDSGDVSWGGAWCEILDKDWRKLRDLNQKVTSIDFDRVFLNMYGFTPFLELRERIESFRTYNFNPGEIREPQKPDPGWFLKRDGSNLASVIETTREIEDWAIDRAGQYLSVITESVEFAGVMPVGGYETLRFRVVGDEKTPPLEFDASSMSDGTLRTLAALVAVFQMAPPHGSPSLVAIEEPETALHPAAMHALVDALDEGTFRTQVLLTTHSAEMLDNRTIQPKNVRVVQMTDGRTVIGQVDEVDVEIVRRKLNTLGGLERENRLEPDLDD